MDANTFGSAARAQDLAVEFAEHPAILAQMFDACIAKHNCAVLTVGNDGVSQLHIMQALQHKEGSRAAHGRVFAFVRGDGAAGGDGSV
jgi:hypothetical protein